MYKIYSVSPRECINAFSNGKIIGFNWEITCPYYQNIFLYEIMKLHARVDNLEFSEDDITLSIGQIIFSLYDPKINNHLWKVSEKATLFIPYNENIRHGFHTIEVGIGIKHNLFVTKN